MEGKKIFFSSHLKQFVGLARLTPNRLILWQIYAVGNAHLCFSDVEPAASQQSVSWAADHTSPALPPCSSAS